MEIPIGIMLDSIVGTNDTHVLQLLKNLYGQKHASRQFCLFMVERLEKIGFQKSRVDDCVFDLEDMVFVVYVDDAIIFMKDQSKFKAVFSKLEAGFDGEEKGDVEQFLGLHFSKFKDHTGYSITQTHLIDQIVADVGLKDNDFKCPQTPRPSTSILHRNQEDVPFDPNMFHYRSVVGILNI